MRKEICLDICRNLLQNIRKPVFIHTLSYTFNLLCILSKSNKYIKVVTLIKTTSNFGNFSFIFYSFPVLNFTPS